MRSMKIRICEDGKGKRNMGVWGRWKINMRFLKKEFEEDIKNDGYKIKQSNIVQEEEMLLWKNFLNEFRERSAP